MCIAQNQISPYRTRYIVEKSSTTSDHSGAVSRPVVCNLPFPSAAWAEKLELEVSCKGADNQLAGDQKHHYRMLSFPNLFNDDRTSSLGTLDGGTRVQRLHSSRAKSGWYPEDPTYFSIPVFFWHWWGVFPQVVKLMLICMVAHIHHFWDVFNRYGRTPRAALHALTVTCKIRFLLLSTRPDTAIVFQLTYTTIFGCYTSYLFLRTSSIYPPISAHMFCNTMRFPAIGHEMRMFPRQSKRTPSFLYDAFAH